VNLGLGLGCLRARGDGLVDVAMCLDGVSVLDAYGVNAVCYFTRFYNVTIRGALTLKIYSRALRLCLPVLLLH